MERFHLALCLAELCSGGKALADGLSIHLARQTEVWSMTGLVWLMTAAIGFSAAALDRRNRTTAEIAQSQDLGQNAGALLFESGERIGQRAPPLYPNVSIRKEYSPKKRNPPSRYVHVAHPSAGRLAVGTRYRGDVRNWVRPHRTPIHSSDILGNFARVEPVSFAVETATASATASGGRTSALRGLPSEESSGPPLREIERPFRSGKSNGSGIPR